MTGMNRAACEGVWGMRLAGAALAAWLGWREVMLLRGAGTLWRAVADAPLEHFFDAGLVRTVRAARALPDETLYGVSDSLHAYALQRFSEMLYPRPFLPVQATDVPPGGVAILGGDEPPPAEWSVLHGAGHYRIVRRAR
jgi:hypothetical protein